VATSQIPTVPDAPGTAIRFESGLKETHCAPPDPGGLTVIGGKSAAEGKAISALFNGVPLSSTKSMMGHSLGAAGAIEAIVCLLALQHQFLPANINFTTPDDDVDLNIVANEARPAVVNTTLSNSFGFGGTNASVLMRKFPPSPRLPRIGDA
jgi:3-oxoacyl-[acyl-carrier-protein] synthase II